MSSVVSTLAHAAALPSSPARVIAAPLRGLAELVRAERRVLDAEAEFDAQLDGGAPMARLWACEHELHLAVKARDAAIG